MKNVPKYIIDSALEHCDRQGFDHQAMMYWLDENYGQWIDKNVSKDHDIYWFVYTLATYIENEYIRRSGFDG